jgi:membrane complex biogenesis BtpA family protein
MLFLFNFVGNSLLKCVGMKRNEKRIIAMIHVGALPGTPQNRFSVKDIVNQALKEAAIYLSCGIDSLLIENMHDVPYLNTKVGPEITASMTAVAVELRKMTPKPLGIQILAGANKEALAIALAAGLDFIRAEGFVFGHVADEGYMDSCAGELLRYRKQIGADEISIFTDVKKKHSSHAITSDVSLAETIKAAEFFLSNGIIITGSTTGKEADLDDVELASRSTNLPIIVGSGITVENISRYWNSADAFIVGSSLKQSGKWQNDVDKEKVTQFMARVASLRY